MELVVHRAAEQTGATQRVPDAGLNSARQGTRKPRLAPQRRASVMPGGWLRSCLPLGALVIGLLGCGSDGSPSVSGETHFLVRCEADCHAPLKCICGACALACEDHEDCEAHHPGSRCVNSEMPDECALGMPDAGRCQPCDGPGPGAKDSDEPETCIVPDPS